MERMQELQSGVGRHIGVAEVSGFEGRLAQHVETVRGPLRDELLQLFQDDELLNEAA